MAARRELEEELGIQVTPGELQQLFRTKESHTHNGGKFIDNEFKDVYLLRLDIDIQDLKLQPEEVSAAKWISLAELKSLVSANDPNHVPHPQIYPQSFAHIKLNTATID